MAWKASFFPSLVSFNFINILSALKLKTSKWHQKLVACKLSLFKGNWKTPEFTNEVKVQQLGLVFPQGAYIISLYLTEEIYNTKFFRVVLDHLQI